MLNLGQGDDQFLFNAEGHTLIDSDLRFNVHAGEGNDTVDFEFTDITNSRLFIQETLGDGNDVSDIAFSGNIDLGSALRVSADLGNGTNGFFGDFQEVGVTDFARARIDITGGNDALNSDVVWINLNDAIGNAIEESDLTIDANLARRRRPFPCRAGSVRFQAPRRQPLHGHRPWSRRHHPGLERRK